MCLASRLGLVARFSWRGGLGYLLALMRGDDARQTHGLRLATSDPQIETANQNDDRYHIQQRPENLQWQATVITEMKWS